MGVVHATKVDLLIVDHHDNLPSLVISRDATELETSGVGGLDIFLQFVLYYYVVVGA